MIKSRFLELLPLSSHSRLPIRLVKLSVRTQFLYEELIIQILIQHKICIHAHYMYEFSFVTIHVEGYIILR